MGRIGVVLTAIAVVCGLPAAALAQSACPKSDAAKTYNGIWPWLLGGAVGFSTSKLAVDADGAPNAYRVDGKGLSYTCDGVVGMVNGKRVTPTSDPKNWQKICQQAWARAKATGDYSSVAIFGFLKDENNRPKIQGKGDPFPGEAYITTTTMTVPGTPAGTQRHWVNAVEIPYVVLSGSFTSDFKISPGDVAVVYRPARSAIAYAIYSDGGNLGEGSVRLHTDLGGKPIIIKDGVERAKREITDRVVTVVYPGKAVTGTTDANAWPEKSERSPKRRSRIGAARHD